jgi:tetratricopeptide (TPR) repeat protein
VIERVDTPSSPPAPTCTVGRPIVVWLPLLAALWFLPGCAAGNWMRAWARRSAECCQLAEQARRAEDRGDDKAAAAYLSQAVSRDPGDADAGLRLSELYTEQGRLDAADATLRRLLVQSPDDPRGHLQRAQVLAQRGRLADAELAVNIALRYDPNFDAALLLAGELAERRRRDDLALELYHRALLTDARPTEAALRVAAIHLRHRRPRQAIPLLRSVADDHRLEMIQRAEASWRLGAAYAQLERWSSATTAMSKATEHRPMTTSDWNQLAYVQVQAGDPQAAEECTAKALAGSPRDPTALRMRGYLSQRKASLLASVPGNDAGTANLVSGAMGDGVVSPAAESLTDSPGEPGRR